MPPGRNFRGWQIFYRPRIVYRLRFLRKCMSLRGYSRRLIATLQEQKLKSPPLKAGSFSMTQQPSERDYENIAAYNCKIGRYCIDIGPCLSLLYTRDCIGRTRLRIAGFTIIHHSSLFCFGRTRRWIVHRNSATTGCKPICMPHETEDNKWTSAMPAGIAEVHLFRNCHQQFTT